MYGYRPHITPKVDNMTDTIVHTTILHEFIRDVDDKKGMSKVLIIYSAGLVVKNLSYEFGYLQKFLIYFKEY